MTLLEAFRSQFIIFMAGIIHFLVRRYINPTYGSDVKIDAPTWILIMVLWFVIGTWARFHFQWPMLGIWAKVLTL